MLLLNKGITKENDLKIWQELIKRDNETKEKTKTTFSVIFDSKPYIVTSKNGTSINAERRDHNIT